MQAFDWSRVWEGDNVLVELTRKERALLLLHVSNVLSTPSTFLIGYDEEDDLEAIDDFLTLLQFHLLDNPPDSAVSMLNIDLFCCNGSISGGTFTYSGSTALPFGYTMFSDTTAARQIKNSVWLKAGEYSYSGWHSLNTNAGYSRVRVYDEANTTLIDTIVEGINQRGTFGTRVQQTGSFTIPSDGFYTIRAENDGSQPTPVAGYSVNWTSHHFRQTA